MASAATLAEEKQVMQPLSPHLQKLQHQVEHAAHLLPAQGPIKVFVHHNTLHAFEEHPFEEAVVKGGRLFGCSPYLPESRYREMLSRERILPEDLSSVLMEELQDRGDELIGFLGTRFSLQLAMLTHPLRQARVPELRWLIAETNALRKFRNDLPAARQVKIIQSTRRWVMRDLRNGSASAPVKPQNKRISESLDSLFQKFGKSSIERWNDDTWEAFTLQSLWRVCHQGVHGVKSFTPRPEPSTRHRDLLLEATGVDIDLSVHDVLIRFCAAFLDQGIANWRLPRREEGFYVAFLSLYRNSGGPPERWMHGLGRELDRLLKDKVSPLESIEESLQLLGVSDEERELYISGTLLALRGWAGMIWQMETRADRVPFPAPCGSLVQFLAVRLILERFALRWTASSELDFQEPLSELRRVLRQRIARPDAIDVDQRAFLVFQMAQFQGWTPEELFRFSKSEWSQLVQEVESFSSLERRRIFHLAFERRYRLQTLDAVAIHANRKAPRTRKPLFQVMCCLDDREESFRRHLEEIGGEKIQTIGAAGFYCVAMYYRGAAEAHFTPLCPVMVRPSHWVTEEVVYTFEESHKRRAKTRRAMGTASHRMHVGSRTFAGGALMTALLGPLATAPLVARVLFPRLTSRIRRMFGRFVSPPPNTRLQLERSEPDPGPEEGHVGFSVKEMTDIGEQLLRDIGLTQPEHFARMVIILGHYSNSLNNPQKSAYDCGACAGANGGPNARALAMILNDSRVRDGLAERKLVIPDETAFVGGSHNTCDDSVTCFDLDLIPKSHREDFEEAHAIIEEACNRNAHERCRRFISAPLNLSFSAARRHVEERSEDLAQARPECGHATNALCIVGRRSRTRNLFMDRRAFLTSYDPTQDDEEGTILARILAAVIPVCAGISLEYYFSYTDPTGWGCGTKLPHNVASLLGVMDGAQSDLRPGLPWQMVEIHEPVRLIFIIETTPKVMQGVMERDEAIARLCRNRWVQVATLSPDTNELHLLQDGQFLRYQPTSSRLPEVASSVEWYRGWRDNLGFAAIQSDLASGNGQASGKH